MPRKQPTLHDAMQSILLDQPEQTATLETLAEENIRRDLYRQDNGDGLHAPPHQFRLRTLDYPDFEVLSDGRIKFVRMRNPEDRYQVVLILGFYQTVGVCALTVPLAEARKPDPSRPLADAAF